jgi:phage terminase large subunit-like protein
VSATPPALEPSPAARAVDLLVAAFGKAQAHRAVDMILDKLSTVELASLAYDWEGTWARPKQRLPRTPWRTFGFLTARGVGKTTSLGSFVVDEVQAGRSKCIGLAAQNEVKTIDVQVGALIDFSPPWFKPEWIATERRLVWPNGAEAYAHTPEVPGAIRSHNFDLAWLSEVQSWPTATRREAYLNFKFATRVGYARTIWDATPKRRHPMLLSLVERSEKEPQKHVIVGGTIYENARNLAGGVIEDLEAEFGGTTAGREELLGEMLADSESALVKQDAIDKHRRPMPEALARRALAIDPAVTTRAGNDRTGMIDAGLGVDGQAYILGDLSGKHPPGTWARIAIDRYERYRIDVIVAETNKGGDLVVQNLRAEAGRRGLSVVVVGKDETPLHAPGSVFVKEVHARGPKEDRAQPLATAYERGRVSHVLGVDLAALEEMLTTWEPTPGHRSPDALDAEVHAVGELLGFASNKPDGKAAFAGLVDLAMAVATPSPETMPLHDLAVLLGGGGAGSRI